MKGAFTPNTNNWSHATNSRMQLTTQLTVISCLTTEKNHSNVAVIIYAINCCLDSIFQLSNTFLQIVASVMIFGITRDSWCNPPGSAPSHRAGLEPGMPSREAGALPRRLKSTASSVSHQSASFWDQGSEVYTQPLLAYIRYTHPPKPHSRAGHGTNVTPPGPHHHTKQVSNPGRRCGRRALYQGG